MDMNNIKKLQGKWNYTEPIEYCYIDYEMLEPIKPTYWSAIHVGEVRQGILINYKGFEDREDSESQTFMIDNQWGDGTAKLRNGGGPDSSHKEVSNYRIIGEAKEPVMTLNPSKLIEESKAFDKYIKANFPELSVKLDKLAAMNKSFMSAMQKDDNDGNDDNVSHA
jgi:hypothetical protein